MAVYGNVILSIPSPEVDRVFDYEIPFEYLNHAEIGMRVKVPFGVKNKLVEGYIIEISEDTSVDKDKIKCISQFPDKQPVFTAEMINTAKWMKERYMTTLSQCLRAMLPAGINLKNEETFIEVSEEPCEYNEKLSPKQKAVLDFVSKVGKAKPSVIKKGLGISASPVETLIKKGLLRAVSDNAEHFFINYDNFESTKPPLLNYEQLKACESILNEKEKRPFLLFGITGSGKTEVYLKIIEEILKEGKQAIVLVPEISLTPLTVKRFVSRFGNQVVVYHSKMSDGERYEAWKKASDGRAGIMIGPRSAVFAPFKNIGAIIIDEEHETSYHSDLTPKYSACEVAEKRCSYFGAKLILGSATPSMESMKKAVDGEYVLLKIEKRAGNGRIPVTEIVDMRTELQNGNRSVFSYKLQEEIKNALEDKKQVMLFLNRRGFSTFVSCRKCGYVMTCSNCSVSYKYHSGSNLLMCHYCGKKIPVPHVCPNCGSKYIKFFGTGTQKVEEEAKAIFPSAVILRMDMDTTKKKGSLEKILSQFGSGNADILIGTQMIAKGHDFKNVSLVGIMAADISLNSGDYRGSENTFQLITQASGRAGRADENGKVIIQTYQSENPIIKLAANQDYEGFFSSESAVRKAMGYPPYGNIFTFLFTGKDERSVIENICLFSDIVKEKNTYGVTVLGPSQAYISKIKNEYRWRLILKDSDENILRSLTKSAVYIYRSSKKEKGVTANLFINSLSSI